MRLESALVAVFWKKILATYSYILLSSSWAPAGIFPEGGETARTDKNDLFFGPPKARTKIFAIFRCFKLNLRVLDASAEGASENFRVFSTGTAYDVIIFKFQGGGATAPGRLPLRASMVKFNVLSETRAKKLAPDRKAETFTACDHGYRRS